MIVSIHQPHYWCWLGLLDKIAKTDTYVVLDNVIINKQSNQRRNEFLVNGKRRFLTLSAKFNDHTPLNEITLTDPSLHWEHLNILREWYSKAKYYGEVVNFIKSKLNEQYCYLTELTIDTMRIALKLFNIKTDIRVASCLDYDPTIDKNLSLCSCLDADIYLSGTGGIFYMSQTDFDNFRNSGIRIKTQKFTHPVYEQDCPFVEGLSCLDLLFFHGIKGARRIFWDNI